jgi:hypothetical protein
MECRGQELAEHRPGEAPAATIVCSSWYRINEVEQARQAADGEGAASPG